MWNILLDKQPEEWDGYKVDMDFRTGIQVSQCIADEGMNYKERFFTAIALMFPEDFPQDYNRLRDALVWYLSGWNPLNISCEKDKSKKETESMDFDVDQGLIFAAFLRQYKIDLSKDELHFWKFMLLLSGLEECTFTKVISIREKKITSKMTKEERDLIRKVQNVFKIPKNKTSEEIEENENEKRRMAIEEFNRFRAK